MFPGIFEQIMLRVTRQAETCRSMAGGYKTKTEDLRPKNEDPLKIFLKSLENGSNMIFDWNKTERNKILRFLSILARVFVLYKTPPKVQNKDPFQIV